MTDAFDAVAHEYHKVLDSGLAASGETSDYFLRGRVAWLAGRLRERGMPSRRVLDFGCGVGSAIPVLESVLGATSLIGVDTSAAELSVARRDHPGAAFFSRDDHRPAGDRDLAYCNGVFHHIPRAERGSAIQYVHDCLKPGGLFALFENNPWNPGTRYVMSKIPFDRDAVMLRASETSRRLVDGGFEILTVDFLFVFPALLRWLRPLERHLASVPLGAQYLVLGRRG
jgi:SAM-dependent methyltransferase